jgi:hypothetical protein
LLLYYCELCRRLNMLIKDRKFFLVRLFTRPLFLFQNSFSLFFKIKKIIENRIRAKLTIKHSGLKKIPPWFENTQQVNLGMYSQKSTCFSLPVYVTADVAELVKIQAGSKDLKDDPEAYFKENRWGFLLESLLVDCKNSHHNQIRVLDWIQSHSDKQDDAWEVYSSCERVSNLLVYLAVISTSSILPDFEKKMIDFILDSVNWIYQYIEYYGAESTNNHILNNARALVMGGAAIENEVFCRAGMQIFRQCMPLMVGTDGFLRERSTHYQLIVTNWILDAWQFADVYYGTQHLDTKYLEDFAQRMTTAASMLCSSDRRLLALIGDISPDTSPHNSSLRLSRLYPAYWPLLNVCDPFLGIKEDWFKISEANQLVLGNFPAGIYPSKFPTHGHSDYTGFVWIYEGIEVLADTGRYRYTPDTVSLLQKSALGHNVLLVDGFSPLCESMVVNGQWCPQPYATANLESWVSSGSVHLSHDGFARATNVLRHTRIITLGEAGLEVVDSLEGSGDAMIRLRWNFGASFEMFDSALMVVKGGDSLVELTTKGFSESPSVDSSSVQLGDGWISIDYGEVVPSVSVDVSGNVKLPKVISTRFEILKCAE